MRASTVPLPRLRELCCPVATPPWDGAEDLTTDMVAAAQAAARFHAMPLGNGAHSARDHAARIAHLVTTGWTDPIEIELGVPGAPGYRPTWPVTDGNHRLYAAIVILPGLKSGASFSFTGDCGRHGPAVLCRLQRRSRVAAADAVPRRP